MGMEKYAKTIIPTIEANYERYTETERHIAYGMAYIYA